MFAEALVPVFTTNGGSWSCHFVSQNVFDCASERDAMFGSWPSHTESYVAKNAAINEKTNALRTIYTFITDCDCYSSCVYVCVGRDGIEKVQVGGSLRRHFH